MDDQDRRILEIRQNADYMRNTAYEKAMRDLARRQIDEKAPRFLEEQCDRDLEIVHGLSEALEETMQQNIAIGNGGSKRIGPATFVGFFKYDNYAWPMDFNHDDITWVVDDAGKDEDFAMVGYQGPSSKGDTFVYRLARKTFDGPIETYHAGEPITLDPRDVDVWSMRAGISEGPLENPDHLYDACGNYPEISAIGNELKDLFKEE